MFRWSSGSNRRFRVWAHDRELLGEVGLDARPGRSRPIGFEYRRLDRGDLRFGAPLNGNLY